MKLSALISTVALASTSSAAALSTINTPRALAPKYICETTEGSPLLYHVNQLIGNLKADRDNAHWCVWHGVGEDKCKSQKGYTGEGGGAVFAVCRGPGPDQPFRCQANIPGSIGAIAAGPVTTEIGGYIQNLRNMCIQKIGNAERVGGLIDFNGDRIKLYSMPG